MKKGEAVLIIEVMKMQGEVVSTIDGFVKKMYIYHGQIVKGGVPLFFVSEQEQR